MIGLSSDGKVKVWLNPNFSKCRPEEHMLFPSQSGEPALVNAMIKQITDIVELQTAGRRFPEFLKINIARATSFEEAI